MSLSELVSDPELMSKYQNNAGNNIVYIETSGRDHLQPRQACAVESGARSGGRVLILINSTSLNLEANNATSQLYRHKDELGISFYSIHSGQLTAMKIPKKQFYKSWNVREQRRVASE